MVKVGALISWEITCSFVKYCFPALQTASLHTKLLPCTSSPAMNLSEAVEMGSVTEKGTVLEVAVAEIEVDAAECRLMDKEETANFFLDAVSSLTATGADVTATGAEVTSTGGVTGTNGVIQRTRRVWSHRNRWSSSLCRGKRGKTQSLTARSTYPAIKSPRTSSQVTLIRPSNTHHGLRATGVSLLALTRSFHHGVLSL